MRRSHCLALAVVVVATASCGSSGKPSTNAVGPPGVGTNASGTPSASASANGSPSGGSKSGSPAPGSTSAAKPGTPTNGSLNPSSSPTSVDPATHRATAEELPITAAVTPACVIPGTAATLKVTTKPKSSLAFVAVYHGDKSGAAPPWGEGYGGNDKGEADDHGKWTYTWTVRADTPSGSAYVMLVVGRNGKQRTINVPFSVGEREVGGCGT